MCQETTSNYLDFKNKHPRTNLNKSSLHLSQNGSDINGKYFTNFISKYDA